MKFLVDANLPRKFSWFNTDEFSFVVDWGDGVSDTEIWNYAIKNGLVILTRDSDYMHRMMQATLYPKVIYFKLPDFATRELHDYFSSYWTQIKALLPHHKMIIAWPSRLEAF